MQGDGVDIIVAYSVLSEMHHSLYATFMPLYTYMLGICPPGHFEAWTIQGLGLGYMANFEMQSMGWFGL